MNIRLVSLSLVAVGLLGAFGAGAWAQQGGAVAQPASETLDLGAIARIRDQGLMHSHVMEYSSGLFDGVGSRLTYSPDFDRAVVWAEDQLKRMGAQNIHTESWDPEGMAWEQIGTSLWLTAPSTATFVAQATPWSPATNGEVTAQVVLVPGLHEDKDLDAWKGKLARKIVLYGSAPKVNADADATPVVEHYDAAKLAHLEEFPLNGDQSETYIEPMDPDFWVTQWGKAVFQQKVGEFFAKEHAVAVLRTNGSGVTFTDDTNSDFDWFAFEAGHKTPLPLAVVSADAYGRMARLVDAKVPVSVKLNIDTKFGGEHVKGENVIAEIAGSDPALKDQVVMVGGHFDSWASGTGATDNGAGTVVALEALRILEASGVKPRRTIRIALWGGEEQGEFGSLAYVNQHFADMQFPSDAKYKDIPTFLLAPTKVTPKADWGKLDAYFNTDNGTGKLLGIFTEGNVEAAHVFSQWGEAVRDLGFSTVSERNTGSTDHTSFDQAGLPGFQFIQDPRDYDHLTHHSNVDTFERMSEPDLKQAATVMAVFLYDAAQRDAMMPRKPFTLEAPDKPLDGIFASVPEKK